MDSSTEAGFVPASSLVRTVTSRTNPTVQEAVRLHRRREREETRLWLAEGPHAVNGAVVAGAVVRLFVTEPSAAVSDIETVVVPDSVLDKIVTTRTHQGIAAVCRQPTAVSGLPHDQPVLALHQAAEPGNVGGAIRTAAHNGMGAVLLTSGSTDPWGPRAVRAAAGALPTMPLITGDAADDALASVDPGRLVALDVRGDVDLAEPWPHAAVLLFGSEAHGLPTQLLERAGQVRSIRQRGAEGILDSLNLSAAVAIATYASAGEPVDE